MSDTLILPNNPVTALVIKGMAAKPGQNNGLHDVMTTAVVWQQKTASLSQRSTDHGQKEQL